MTRSTTLCEVVLILLSFFLAHDAHCDTLALRDGTMLEGIIGNREILASSPYAFDAVAILVEETGEYRVVPMKDVLYILLVDGDVKRLIDVVNRSTETAPRVAGSPGVTANDTIRTKTRDTLKLGLGVSFPLKPNSFDQGWHMGWSGSVRIRFFLNPAACLNIGFEYNRFGIDTETLTEESSGVFIEGGSLSVFYLPVEIEFRPPDAVRTGVGPYLVLGSGYYTVNVADAWVSVAGERHQVFGEQEQVLGFHFGAGVTAGHWFIEGMAVYGLTNVESTGHWAIRTGIVVDGSSVGH